MIRLNLGWFLLPLVVAGFAQAVSAAVFFQADYEDCTQPPAGVPSPVWVLPPTFPENFGLGEFFNISEITAHSGKCSLQVTYEARNGFCNTCGGRQYIQSSGITTVATFVDKNKTDLTLADDSATARSDDGPKAIVGRTVYNTSAGYSVWQISSITSHAAVNDRLNLTLLKPGTKGQTTITSGNSIALVRQCDVDGLIGVTGGINDVSRRNDCNNVITWFGNTSRQAPATSIFRRQYLRPEVKVPVLHQKLHYLRPDEGGVNQGEIVIFGDKSDGVMTPLLTGLKSYGSPIVAYSAANSSLSKLSFENGIWYYMEEEYLAATVKSVDINGNPTAYNPDGSYRLWLSKAGQEPVQNSPTLEITGIALPGIAGGTGTHISFWGNFQHWTDHFGNWFIDDVVIGDSFNGAADGRSGANSPPSPPAVSVK